MAKKNKAAAWGGLRLAELLIAYGVAFKNPAVANHVLRRTWFNA